MKNAAMVASHRACSLMGSTNLLLETVKNFVVLSPYRPFGTYVLCTGNGRLVVMKNSEAVLQVLFHSAVLGEVEGNGDDVVMQKVLQHLGYVKEVEESFEMQDVVYLEKLEEVPLSSNDASNSVNIALNDLGLVSHINHCFFLVLGWSDVHFFYICIYAHILHIYCPFCMILFDVLGKFYTCIV